MKYYLALIISILYSLDSFAQADEKVTIHPYKYNNNFDLSINYSRGQFAGAIAWAHLHVFGKKKQKFKIGYGLRFTSFIAANQLYTTTPSKFTSTVQGIGTINSETIIENLDTISFQTPQVNLLNLAIYH